MRRILAVILICLQGIFFSGIAVANISLDRVIVVFSPDERPIQTVGVINVDEKRTFAVKTQVTEVLNAGKETQKVVESKSLAVAPNAFEVLPKKKRNVRLLLRELNKSDIEKVYRVSFIPESPSRTVEKTNEKGVTAKVDIIIGMGALILVPPKNIDYKLDAKREGKKLLFSNIGNISAEVQPIDLCKSEGDCFRFNGARLYPGTTFEYELPEGYEKVGLNFSVRAAGKYSAVEFAPLNE